MRIIDSILDLDKKIESLDYLESEESKLKIISKIHNSRKRIYALGKINNDYAIAYRLMSGEEEKDNISSRYDALNLPSDMTIGIEIESEGENYSLLPDDLRNWEGKIDCSIGNNGKGGKEYASPIMHDTKKDVNEIYIINEILKRMGMKITPKCGGHVHIGADYIKSEEGFRELAELWGNAEKIYYLISNRPGELPREGVKRFAQPISEIFEEANIENIPEDRFIINAKRIVGFSRYRSVNFLNVNNSMNTIEFRISNGTLDGDTWIENIRLYGRTVQIAQELGIIRTKLENGEELTEEEKTKYALKEMLKDDIPLDEKMDILMQILFSEEEQEVYYERYRANKKLEKEENVVSNLKFGKVDFKKVYEGVDIPEGIIEKIKKAEEERTESETR